jgi:ATP-binding cassette subfamily C protein LapB
VQAGDLTIGALIASSILASRAMGPISAAIGIISRAHQSLSQFKTVAELLALEPERHDPQSAVTVEPRAGAYDLRAVSFTYPDSVEPALTQISLTIRRGERIGLIGRSGSGKSTLLELLSGLIEPSQGRVLVDGHNMTHFRVDALRSRIAYGAQDATLFDTTLRENLMLGLSQIDAQALELAVRLTGVDVIAQTLPDGFSTKLGQRGGRLSGGQRQAVVLARTLARPSDALLLDEPTAAMDAATEQRLIQALEPLSRDGRTFIVASHRMDVLRLVDRVIWLDAGRIVADKPRDEVLALFRSKAQSA